MNKQCIRLKELRLERGLLQKELAPKLGMSLRQLQRYENNENELSLSIATEIADFFCVSLDFLSGRSNERGIWVEVILVEIQFTF